VYNIYLLIVSHQEAVLYILNKLVEWLTIFPSAINFTDKK